MSLYKPRALSPMSRNATSFCRGILEPHSPRWDRFLTVFPLHRRRRRRRLPFCRSLMDRPTRSSVLALPVWVRRHHRRSGLLCVGCCCGVWRGARDRLSADGDGARGRTGSGDRGLHRLRQERRDGGQLALRERALAAWLLPLLCVFPEKLENDKES